MSLKSTAVSTNVVLVTTDPSNGQTSALTQSTVIATVVPATTVYATTVVSSTESPTGIAGLQAQGISGSGGGLSTGAKAGIGAGVGVAVIAAAIIGAVYAMRRRKKNAISDDDRYPPSSVPSFFGGVAGAALGKRHSRYTESDMGGSGSPPMREQDPMARYHTPGVSSQRTTLPPNSRTSDISSMSGNSEPAQYRPGPGMPPVSEQYQQSQGHELPEQDVPRPHQDYLAPAAAAGYADAAGNPFHERHEKSGGDTPSLYSHDGDDAGVNRHPSTRQTGSPALELPGETAFGSVSGPGGQGYRGVDPEEPLHTRTRLQQSPPRTYDPSHNF